MELSKLRCVFASLCLTAFFLTSCASIPITSLPKLAGVKAETIDLSQVELAIRINDDYRVMKNSAKLGVIFKNDLTGKTFQEEIILPETIAPLTKYLKKQKKPGFVMYRYKLNANATETANNFRESVLKFRAENHGDNSMTLNASAGFCSIKENNVSSDILLKFYIKTKSEQEFYTLLKQQKMSFLDKQRNKISLGPCTAKNSFWGE